MSTVRTYALVTVAYWALTLTDGALRTLALLHFHQLGYGALQLASLFVLYELFGVVTNLWGGWIAARAGLRVTLLGGLGLQVVAIAMLSYVDPSWSAGVAVPYVMSSQALSGIAKDLTKMSAKSSIKLLVPEEASSALFKWVAALTGSKNALKGMGFFAGGALLGALGFAQALQAMAVGLLIVLVGCGLTIGPLAGQAKTKASFSALFSKSREINVLSAARFFLFGSRDVWFVVGVPVFLSAELGWSYSAVGTFLAAWVIGYGVIQSFAPAFIRRWTGGEAPQGRTALVLATVLAVVNVAIVLGLHVEGWQSLVVLLGLGAYGIVFALNSSVHSYLILAYSDGDEIALNVGFYYMANAGGRLVGTVLSGALYQLGGLSGCLYGSATFVLATALLSSALPRDSRALRLSEMGTAGGED